MDKPVDIKDALRVIRIMGHDVDIRYDANYAKDQGGQGGFASESLWIALDTSYPPTQLNETLLHELVEAINYFGELKLKHSAITRLGNGLHQIFADNSGVLQFLIENWRKHDETQKASQQQSTPVDKARKARKGSQTHSKKT
jgi:hypothetical protein